MASRALWLSAGRRFAVVLAAIGGVTLVISLLLALVTGTGVSRAVSVGFYIVGSMVTLGGFLAGNRGPLRFGRRVPGEPRRVHWQRPAERTSGINESVVFVAVGFSLLVLGVLADTRHPLT